MMGKARQLTSSEEVRNEILDSIGYLLDRYGYKKMTVDDIASHVGIGKGTVYLYFSSKEEMALSWLERIHDRLVQDLRSVANSDMDITAKLREILIRRVMNSFDSMQTCAQSLDELFAAVRPSLLTKRQGYHADYANLLALVLREGCASGIFRLDDIDAAADALVLATNSLLPYSLSTVQLGERDQIEAKATIITDLLLKGLLTRSPR